MRPYVKQAQKLPPGAPAIANPQTKAGIAALNTFARLGSTRLVSSIDGKLLTPPADNIELPGYPTY